jgi:Holliday junction resolvase RusA-like endonuclease
MDHPYHNRLVGESVLKLGKPQCDKKLKILVAKEKITTGMVMLQITYFYDSIAIDVDNIVKPIQDAIIGLVYVDDD